MIRLSRNIKGNLSYFHVLLERNNLFTLYYFFVNLPMLFQFRQVLLTTMWTSMYCILSSGNTQETKDYSRKSKEFKGHSRKCSKTTYKSLCNMLFEIAQNHFLLFLVNLCIFFLSFPSSPLKYLLLWLYIFLTIIFMYINYSVYLNFEI